MTPIDRVLELLDLEATECPESWMQEGLDGLLSREQEIAKLTAENDRLAKMFADDCYIESAHMEPGYYNINTRGKGAMLLAGQLLQYFRQSCGKNFLTSTFQMEFGDSKTMENFELTIQKVGGNDSPAQKITRQAKRIKQLEAQLIRERERYIDDFIHEFDEYEDRSEEAREQLQAEDKL
jgi:hypothetical protein